ncbi:asparaginase-domain-containing protein [Podospora australis]|uniref:Asparaginase-domain-containing protein n=1 Tax=Podospora australis TaxID=1536484 RepID=A0AAN6WLY9_9PEZI|nr:asparaginase-domain-containing protein [Podospora australis]
MKRPAVAQPTISACAAVALFLTTITSSASASATGNGKPSNFPFVINTWGGAFTAATDAAYLSLVNSSQPASALDAVEIGCATCERNQCDTTVGFGGSPDENCETTLDAMIMDGTTMKTGAVAGMRRIKDAIGVARAVLLYTRHSLLVGDLATEFAVANGFREQDLSTEESTAKCSEWKRGGCRPNYRLNVSPDPDTSCGPYTPLPLNGLNLKMTVEEDQGGASHDTISMVVIHSSGEMAAGTSTNGASHKVPGRVGDGPIVGSGSYVDGDVGGCGATGDGDIMMRFLPCYQAVENLRRGMTPTEAAEDAVHRMVRKYPNISSGIVVVDKNGEHGGAGSGWTFTYSYRGGDMGATEVVTVPPVTAPDTHRSVHTIPDDI